MAKPKPAPRRPRAARKIEKPAADPKRENAGLKRELARALDRQTATGDVLKAISRSTADLDNVLDTLVATVARLCRADQSYMFRRQDDMFYMVAARGLSKEAKEFIRAHPATPDRSTMSGRVALGRRTVHIHDVLRDPEYKYKEGQRVAGFRTILGIPLLRGDDLLGIFVAGRMRVDPFTDEEIELATTFADQAVIAIENARLIAERREALEQQTATSEVLQVINSSPSNLAPVFEAMLEKAMRLCSAAFGALGVWKDDRFTWLAIRGPKRLVDHAMKREAWLGPRSGFSRIAKGSGHVQFADISASKFYLKDDPHTRAMVDLGGAHSTLAVPLTKEGEAVGVLSFYRHALRLHPNPASLPWL